MLLLRSVKMRVLLSLSLISFLLYTNFFDTVMTDIDFSTSSRTSDVCDSAVCDSVAQSLLNGINQSVDPCKDFYEFACGKWITNNTAELSGVINKLHIDVYHTVRDRLENNTDATTLRSVQLAKLYYRSCLDEEQIASLGSNPLTQMIERLGEWPLLTDRNPPTFDVSGLLANIVALFDTHIFFQLYPSFDSMNRKIFRYTIEQVTPILQSRDYYLRKNKFSSKWNDYKTLIYGVINILRKDINNNSISLETEMQIEEMLNFEEWLAYISVPPENQRNETLQYNLWATEQLSEKIPYINWTVFFNTTIPAIDFHQQNISDFRIVVRDLDYMIKLKDLMTKTNYRTVVNYIFWRFVYERRNVLDSRFQTLFQKFHDMEGVTRKYICYKLTSESLPTVIGALYIRDKFVGTGKKDVATSILTDIKNTFEELVTNSAWLDEKTKLITIQKIEHIKFFIGHVDYLTNDMCVDLEYENLHYTDKDSFFAINQKLAMWKRDRDNGLHELNIQTFDVSSPSVVNTFNIQETNVVLFNAAMLQFPFFDTSFPNYINYGIIGFLLAHELIHAIDDKGMQVDNGGNLVNWFSSYSYENFRKRQACLIERYNQFLLPEYDLHVSGQRTVSENIADVAGIAVAFKAYQSFQRRNNNNDEPRLPGLENFTNEQMFFLNFAQIFCERITPSMALSEILVNIHTPNYFRVNGVVMNSNEFVSAFNCVKNVNTSPLCYFW